jgi:hypothetical protein
MNTEKWAESITSIIFVNLNIVASSSSSSNNPIYVLNCNQQYRHVEKQIRES